MATILRIRLKLLKRPLLGIIFALLFLSIFLPSNGFTTPATYANSTEKATGNAVKRWQGAIAGYQSGNVPTRLVDLPAQRYLLRQYRQLMTAVQSRDYASVNSTAEAMLKQVPNDLYRYALITDGQADNGFDPSGVFRYLNAHRLAVTPFVSESSDALNIVGNTLGIFGEKGQGWSQWNGNLNLLLVLGASCLMLAVAFSDDSVRGTRRFVRTMPRSEMGYSLGIAGLQLAVMNLMLLMAIGLNIVFLAASPSHHLGNVGYPVAFIFQGVTHIMPIWMYFGRWLLLINLWMGMLSGLAFVVSLVSKSEVVNVFVLAVCTFSRQLGILAFIPSAWQRYNPLFYDQVPEVFFANRLGYTQTSTAVWGLTFGIATCLLWSVGALIIFRRTHRRPAAVN